MPILPKPRDEALAQHLAKGTMTLKEAWIAAGYPYDGSRATTHSKRSFIQERIMEIRKRREKVQEAIEVENNQTIAKKLGITREKVIQGLWFNAQRCLRGQPVMDAHGVHTGQFSGKPDAQGANRSLELVGKELFGMFVERLEIGGPGDFSRLSDDELLNRLQIDGEVLGLDPGVLEPLMITDQSQNNPETDAEGS